MSSHSDLEKTLLYKGEQPQTLLDIFNNFRRNDLKLWLSTGGRKLSQIIQPREYSHDDGISISISIYPLDVEIEYKSKALKTRKATSINDDIIPADEDRFDEKIVIRGSKTMSREIDYAYVVSSDGTVSADPDHPLLKDVHNINIEDTAIQMIRFCADVLFEQCMAAYGSGGLINLVAEPLDIPYISPMNINCSRQVNLCQKIFSWGQIPMCALIAGLCLILSPRIKISPLVGCDRPQIMLIVVVFPAPLGPRKPKTSPL